MKRILALSLTITLLLSFFTCCGSRDGTPAGESVETTVGTNEPADDTQSTTAGLVSEENTETSATTPTEPVPDPTTPPTEPVPTQPKLTEPQLEDWRTAYLGFLEIAKDDHTTFALVYIDGDNIPELYLNGNCEATGDAVCTYKNSQVIEQRIRRTWGGSYIPGAGLIKNTNGNMGYYTTDIYRLTDSGFTNIWSGLETQEIIPSENGNEEPEWDIFFSVGDQAVSEEAYYAAIENVFNTSRAVQLHENAVSYDAIRQLILGS